MFQSDSTFDCLPQWRALLSLLLLLASAVQAEDAGTDADLLTFKVTEYRVRGNSVLSAVDIGRAVYPYLGTTQSMVDVEAAREALGALYREAGYNAALVSIPEQSVDSGVVILDVVEGNVGRVRVSGARYVSGREIRADVASVQPGRPINFPSLQEDLAAINSISPDRSVTPLLRSGRNPGEVDLELRVDDKLPIHAGLEINDRYTVDTAELRTTATLSYDNLFQRFHSLSLQYTTAPEDRDNSEVWALTYLARFRNSPAILALYAVDTASDVATIGDLNVLGDGRIYGLRYVYPMATEVAFFHSVTGRYRQQGHYRGQSGIPCSHRSAIRTAAPPMRFGWNFDGYRSSYDVGIGLGLRPLGNSVQEFEDKRFNARPNYSYLRLGTEQLLRVAGGVGLYGRLIGQWTPQPLINNEQLSAGGWTTVRGYLEAERLGDYGAIGQFEVRTPNFGNYLGDSIDTLYWFAFYDAAQLGLNDSLPGQDPHFELYSTGIGLRFAAWNSILAGVDYAHPLRDSINVQSGDERLHFQLNWTF